MNESSSGIFVSVRDAEAYARVLGRGSHQNAQPFRQWLQIQSDSGCRRLHIDLSQCQGMDSTFLGLLAGFGLRRRSTDSKEHLHLFNTGERHLRSCQSVGLDRLAQIDPVLPEDSTFQPPLDCEFQQLPDTALNASRKPADPLAAAQTMLEAHENLCAADERNEAKFKDVKELLREEIARRGDNPPPLR